MKSNFIWLIAAALFLGAAIVELRNGSLTSVFLFLLAAAFGYAGFRSS